jgi:hypothetical protein
MRVGYGLCFQKGAELRRQRPERLRGDDLGTGEHEDIYDMYDILIRDIELLVRNVQLKYGYRP